MYGRIAEVGNRRFFPSKAVKFISDILWDIHPHSPGAAFLSSNEAE